MTGRRLDRAARKEDLRRVARVLGHKIRDAGLSFRDVSDRLGWPADRLSHVLKGRLLLRLEDLYGILDLLGLSPSAFFAEVERTAPRSHPGHELEGGDPHERPVGGLTRGELFAAIQRAVREELDVREQRRREVDPRGARRLERSSWAQGPEPFGGPKGRRGREPA